MKRILNRLFDHETLTKAEAEELMLGITRNEYNDSQTAALLAVFRLRGVTADELVGFRNALLSTCVSVDFAPYAPIDIVGTGGDGRNTFNISTCAAFVVAGAGYKVAKHGNYGATSVSGASNVMEQHGVRFTADADRLRRSMEECNIAYLHAPLFSPAMKFVAPVRKALQVRTVFNLLGPLVNPCRPAYQLLGVADLAQMRLYANCFRSIGTDFAVVCGLDGYDEISLTSEFKVCTSHRENIYRPADLGLDTVDPAALYGGATREEAAAVFDGVLRGEAPEACKQCVAANAAFAIRVIEPERSVEDCLAAARESIDSGRALRTFERYVELNR